MKSEFTFFIRSYYNTSPGCDEGKSKSLSSAESLSNQNSNAEANTECSLLVFCKIPKSNI